MSDCQPFSVFYALIVSSIVHNGLSIQISGLFEVCTVMTVLNGLVVNPFKPSGIK